MTPTRRTVLKGLAAAGAAGLAGRVMGVGEAAADLRVPPGFDLPLADLPLPFAHGVASGDPLADRVILWTRVTAPDAGPDARIAVRWFVARDPALRDRVATGEVVTDAARDFTVKVEPSGLDPATTYYYAFDALGRRSLTGRTRTAPASDVDEVRIAVVSCSSFWSGHFNAYGRIADRNDLDLVLHCGDHIYDFPDREEWVRARDGRFDPADVDFRNWTSLDEIRRRYALHYSDPDFLRLHQQHPITVTWDNHDLDPQGATPEDAFRAYWEWTPARPPAGDASGATPPPAPGLVDPADQTLQYRTLPYGPMADLFVIDTRSQRGEGSFDERAIMSQVQLDWLTSTLAASSEAQIRWRVVLNQVPMGQIRLQSLPAEGLGYPPQLREGVAFYPGWDTHPRQRAELYAFLREAGVGDNLVCSGDIHGNFCHDLVERNGVPDYEPATGGGLLGSVGVEFLPSSVTRGGADETLAGVYYDQRWPGDEVIDRERFESAEVQTAGVAGARGLEGGLREANPNLRFIDWVEHGYGVLHLTAAEALLEYWWCPILEASPDQRLGAVMRVVRGTDHAVQVLQPTPSAGSRTAEPAPTRRRAVDRARRADSAAG